MNTDRENELLARWSEQRGGRIDPAAAERVRLAARRALRGAHRREERLTRLSLAWSSVILPVFLLAAGVLSTWGALGNLVQMAMSGR